MKHRLERVNELLKRELGELLGREVSFEAALVTVQQVDITPDLKHAHDDVVRIIDATMLPRFRKMNPSASPVLTIR